MHPIFKKATAGVVLLTSVSFYGFATGIEAPAPALDLDMTTAVEVMGHPKGQSPALPPSNRLNHLCDDLARGPSWSRGLAAQLLGSMGDSRAVDPLLLALKDANPWVATKAAEALGKIASRRSVNGLLTALRTGHHTVRREACRALTRIADPRIRPALQAASHDDSTWVRRIAVKAVRES